MNARANQVSQQAASVETQLRVFIDGSNSKMAVIDNQISSLNGKVIVGGSGIAIVGVGCSIGVEPYVAEPRSSPVVPTITWRRSPNGAKADLMI